MTKINGWDRMLQEHLLEMGRWNMCCGCIMLNLTNRRQAEPVWPVFFDWYPDAKAYLFTARHREEETKELLEPMGMANVRFKRLMGLSRDWLRRGDPESADDLEANYHGMGRYAGDSWRIFVEGRRDVEPTDRVLQEYLHVHRSL
jgi:endonuclease III